MRLVHRQWSASGGADRVHVEGHPALTREPTHRAHGLERPDLAVRGHDRDEGGVVAQRPRHRLRVHAAVGIHTDVRDVPAALLEVPARVEDRDVLDRGGHEVAAPGALGHAADREVVRLGRARGEDHASRRRADQPGDLRARAVERGARLQTERVECRRVADAAFEEGAHDRDDPGVDR